MIDLDAIRTLADIPAAQARKRGDAVAVKFGDRETRFAELDAQSNRVAHALIAAGVAPGDRVSVLTKNHDAWYPLFFGTARARACLAPINCRLAAGEIAFILGDAGPKLLFVGEDFFDTALAAVAGLPNPPRLVALYGAHPAFESLDAWIGDAPATPPADEPQLGDDVLQLYTSGTTGRPKGVVLANRTYRRFLEMATEIDGFAYDEDETVMIVMPLFHVAGTNVSFSGLAQGGRLVLVKDFAAGDAIAMLSEERVAHAFLAPAMIQMMLQQPGAETGDYARLRSIAYGASPIAEDVLRRARAVFGCDFVQFYGMTESAGGGSYLSPAAHDLPGKLTSCGQPWPGAEMAILDGEGRPLGDGEIGEIAIRGDIVMKEYWNRPEATVETVVDGWLHTGDVGRLDEDGYLTLVDRIKDMIIRGGENLYPKEIENALATHPAVLESAVIGAPHEVYGEVPVAYVVTYPERTVTDSELLAHLAERLTRVKVPAEVHVVAALPRNPVGKIDKPGLRRSHGAPVHA